MSSRIIPDVNLTKVHNIEYDKPCDLVPIDWLEALVQMEDNVNLATLDQIQNCKMDGGVPAIGCDSMNNILEYNKFKGGLKQLDDFLDSYKGN